MSGSRLSLWGMQTDIAWEDPRANFSRIEAQLAEGPTPQEGTLLVFPELATTGFTMNTAVSLEAREGESAQFFSQLAQRYRSYVLAGLAAPGDHAGAAANEAVCYGPDGKECARYRKRRPFPLAQEAQHYEAGQRAVVFEIEGWKVAPLICYDLRFPELFREAVALGAELFVVIANWPQARVDHWTTLLRARAIENLAYVLGVNRAGSDPKLSYPGASLLVGPKGEVLAEAGAAPGVLRGVIEHEPLEQWRRDFPALEGLHGL